MQVGDIVICVNYGYHYEAVIIGFLRDLCKIQVMRLSNSVISAHQPSAIRWQRKPTEAEKALAVEAALLEI